MRRTRHGPVTLPKNKSTLAPDGRITDEKNFALYRRYETQHERAYNKALQDREYRNELAIRLAEARLILIKAKLPEETTTLDTFVALQTPSTPPK